MEILAEPFAILLKLLWHDGIAFLAILALSTASALVRKFKAYFKVAHL